MSALLLATDGERKRPYETPPGTNPEAGQPDPEPFQMSIAETKQHLESEHAKLQSDCRNARSHVEDAINLLHEASIALVGSNIGIATALIQQSKTAIDKAEPFLPDITL